MTVTATASGAQEVMGALAVRVLTGAAAAQPGAVVPAFPSPAVATITPEGSGSIIYGSVQIFPGTTTLTGESGTTILCSDDTEDVSYGALSAPGTVAGTAITVGASAPAGEFNDLLLIEVLAAAGETLAEDPSTPAAITSETATSLTTASFDPPPGSTLIAVVSSLSTTAAMSDTTGLAWTPLGESIGTFCGIFTATVPSGGGGDSGTGTAALSLAASASGAPSRTGTGPAAVALAASATGTAKRAGSGSAAVSLTASSAGSPARRGTGTAVLTLAASSTGAASAAATAALSLAVSSAGVAARAGAGSAHVAMAASASGASARSGNGGAGVTFSASASGSSARSGTGTAMLRLSGSGAAPAPVVPQQTGSWWGLVSVLEQNRQEFEADISRPRVACPVCGQPLVNAPSTKSGSGVELYCNYAGDHQYHYPRDSEPPMRLDSGGLREPW